MSLLRKSVFLSFTFLMVLGGCGGENNIADCDNGKKPIPCTEKSAEEKGRINLDDKQFEAAVENFKLALEADPENYNLYTLLATAYSGAAGFSLLDVTKAQLGGEGSILEILGNFLPTPANTCTTDGGEDKTFTDCIDLMKLALTTADLPEGGKADATTDFYKTAQKQLMFYGSASTVMQINRFTISADSGSFDPAQLENMTEEDAVAILDSLATAGSVAGLSDDETKALQEKIAQAQSDIQSQEGGTTKEKLAAFINKDKGTDSGSQ